MTNEEKQKMKMLRNSETIARNEARLQAIIDKENHKYKMKKLAENGTNGCKRGTIS